MQTFAGPIAMEGTSTGDGRLIADGALTWPDEAIPFRSVFSDTGQHDNAVVVGQITSIERLADGVIWGEGFIDSSLPDGEYAAKLVREGLQTGVSIDPDDITVEFQTKDGGEPDETTDFNDVIQVLTAGRIRAATLVAIPAFIEAHIATTGEAEEAVAASGEETLAELWTARLDVPADLTAAAVVHPPAKWFSRPDELDGPTRVKVAGDHIYGYLATWGTCHIGFGEDRCVQPPPSHHDYAFFTTGVVLTDDGTEIETGVLTMNTGHASKKAAANAAAAHYDDTGTAFADVKIGEDETGIWFSGALRPEVTDEQRRVIRASALSGDWRRRSGGLELVAALAVNTPGFPIIESSMAASGCPETLIAAGLVMAKRSTENASHPSKGLLAGAEAIARGIGRDRDSRKQALARRVHRDND